MEDDTKKWIWYAIPVVVVVALGAALYYGRKSKEPAPEPQAKTAPAPVAPETTIQHPLEPDTASTKPLPALDESDADAKDSLTSAFGRPLEQYLVPQSIVRNVVVTIDNLPRKKAAVQRWPIKQTAGTFATVGGDDPSLSPANYARYEPLIAIVRNADAQQVATLYRRYYPLLQQAYVDLGYPNGYFNDRLVQVIDHLLQTPEVNAPVKLTQPGVFYQFADPALEDLSAGQKLLIRMGPANAAIVKTKLRSLREAVTRKQ